MKPITGCNDVVENYSTLLEKNNCPFQQSIIIREPTHEVKEISEPDVSLGSYQ